MPRGQPFTRMCQITAQLAKPVAADLHLHTTASDGDSTQAQVVAAARAAGLSAIAITDHDTTAGVAGAVAASREWGSGRVEIIAGVEVSAEFDAREVHVLGLFVRPDDSALAAALADVCAGRRERFRDFIAHIPELQPVAELGFARLIEEATVSLGRRHVAGLLVRAGVVKTRHAAFSRYLSPAESLVRPKPLIPIRVAAALIRSAGGIASLAHPPLHVDESTLIRLRDLGVQAIEVRFPAATPSRTAELRSWADRCGLAVTGGSDCHGAQSVRGVGSLGVTAAELTSLRELAG